MAKFASKQTQPKPRPVTKTTGAALTHEGGRGFTRDDESQLFLQAVTNMVGENKFYESADESDTRFVSLIHNVTRSNPSFIQGFAPFLRKRMNMRSASLVMVAEYIAVGGPNGRALVNEVLSRPDEPAEILGYWVSRYGKKIPQALKRGIADSATRMYSEAMALKYDSARHDWRPADVIELTHPKPKADWQSSLFRYLIDKRHNRDDIKTDGLETVARYNYLHSLPMEKRVEILRGPDAADVLASAGMTWENVSSWIEGDKYRKEAWEAIVPSMGYMALLRNLRNLEKYGVSKDTIRYVQDKLSDPAEVAKSKQFPYRFFSAYRELDTLTFGHTLETALDSSTSNIPVFEGGTLVCVDTSGSMGAFVSAKSKVKCYEVAAIIGAAIAKKGQDVTYVEYADSSGEYPLRKGASVLKSVEATAKRIGKHGHGTNTWQTVEKYFDPKKHKRVILIGDCQAFPYLRGGYGYYAGGDPKVADKINKAGANVYSFVLGGYAQAHTESKPGQYEIGGFSDAAFNMISLIESGRDAKWPWEITE